MAEREKDGFAMQDAKRQDGAIVKGRLAFLLAAALVCAALVQGVAGATVGGAAVGPWPARAWAAELSQATVQQRIDEGSLGFFKSLGDAGEKAVAVLENPAPAVAGCTNMGAEGDATSLYNLWQTLRFMDECNQLRADEGYDPQEGEKLQTLKVDPELMAIAEVQLNWSRDNIGHSEAYNVGENLAWGYYDPFDGWYYKEKKIYDEGGSGETGHYLHIVASGYQTTGFAVAEQTNGIYGTAHGQTFDGVRSGNEDDLMTVAEFRAALEAYLPAEYLPASFEMEWSGSDYVYRAIYADGSPAEGWLSANGAWCYANADGYLARGWVHDGTGWYWMDRDYAMVTGWQPVSGEWYYLDPSAGGRMATGWKSVGGAWYWLYDSGAMATGWYKVNGEWNWSDSSGVWHANSWVKSGSRWWYAWADGTYPTSSWQLIGGKWYHFDGSGYMQTGWLNLGGTWYYLNAGGDMATGWKNVDGTWYYLNSGGDMATGWKLLGSTWYYLNADGDMATGWKNVGGTWYYLNGDGSMAANRWVGNYYVGASGAMATNQWIGDYYVDDSGLWDQSRTKEPVSQQPVTTAYVGNSSTMKFHASTCAYVKKIDAANVVALSTRDAAERQGYSPCGHCNP